MAPRRTGRPLPPHTPSLGEQVQQTMQGSILPRTARSFAADIGRAVSAAVVEARDADMELEYLKGRAPNAIEWISGSEFLGDTIMMTGTPEDPRPHWGMYRAIRDFFELRCPICNDARTADPWGKGREALETEVLLVYDRNADDDVCPKCRITRAELLEDKLVNGHNTLHLVVGMRAGKSDTLALVGTYVEHVLLTLSLREEYGIHRFLGIPPTDILETTFLASTDVQAKDTIWTKFVNKRRLSPWMRRYVPWVKGQEGRQKTPEGMRPWKYQENDKEIENGHALLRLNSLNSNSGGLVGRTRPAAFADEISRMKQTESAMSADEVYRGLEHSLITVRSQVKNRKLRPTWLGMMASITSPMSIDDKGMRLLEMAQNDHRVYARKYATWDYSPFQPRENFDQEFATDPTGSDRDFGANPPAALNPLIHDRLRFRESVMDPKLKPTVGFQPYHFKDMTGRGYIALRAVHANLVLQTPHYCAFDAGKNFDAFAGAMAHAEVDENGDVVSVLDWCFRILPNPREEVWFDCILDMVREIHKQQFVVEIEFDQWNSVHLIQKIREMGIRAEQVSLKPVAFIRFMRDAYLGRVRMLPCKPEELREGYPADVMSAEACAIYEIERLERDPKTDKVFNPAKGERRGWNSDDMARVITHAHQMVQNRGFTESQDDISAKARRKRAETMMSEWSANDLGRIYNPRTAMPGIKFHGGGRGW